MTGGGSASIPWFLRGPIYFVNNKYFIKGVKLTKEEIRELRKYLSVNGFKMRIRVLAKSGDKDE